MTPKSTDNDAMSFSSQLQMEILFSKHQVREFLRQECIDAGFDKDFQDINVPVGFGLDLLSQMILYKRANLETLVGLLHSHFTSTSDSSAHQQCADMLYHCVQEDVLDYDEDTQVFVIRHDIDDPTQKQLNQFQYPLPMIEHPEPVTNNKETGYQTITGSLLLKHNHHDEDICLDHINRANSIPLRLNPDIVAFVQNKWKQIDHLKPDESYQDFKKRQKAFEKYDSNSRDVLAALMAAGDQFWLTHKYDKRGRTYAQGYHVNYQGNDWNKSCIEFALGEKLNDI